MGIEGMGTSPFPGIEGPPITGDAGTTMMPPGLTTIPGEIGQSSAIPGTVPGPAPVPGSPQPSPVPAEAPAPALSALDESAIKDFDAFLAATVGTDHAAPGTDAPPMQTDATGTPADVPGIPTDQNGGIADLPAASTEVPGMPTDLPEASSDVPPAHGDLTDGPRSDPAPPPVPGVTETMMQCHACGNNYNVEITSFPAIITCPHCQVQGMIESL